MSTAFRRRKTFPIDQLRLEMIKINFWQIPFRSAKLFLSASPTSTTTTTKVSSAPHPPVGRHDKSSRHRLLPVVWTQKQNFSIVCLITQRQFKLLELLMDDSSTWNAVLHAPTESPFVLELFQFVNSNAISLDASIMYAIAQPFLCKLMQLFS